MSKLHKTIELSNLDDPSNRSILKNSMSADNIRNINVSNEEDIYILDVEMIVDLNKIIKIVTLSLVFNFFTVCWYSFTLLFQFSVIEEIFLGIPIAIDYVMTIITMILFLKYLIEIKLLEQKKKIDDLLEKKKDFTYIEKLNFVVNWRFYEWYIKYLNYLIILKYTSEMTILSYCKLILLFINWNLYNWLKIMHMAAYSETDIYKL